MNFLKLKLNTLKLKQIKGDIVMPNAPDAVQNFSMDICDDDDFEDVPAVLGSSINISDDSEVEAPDDDVILAHDDATMAQLCNIRRVGKKVFLGSYGQWGSAGLFLQTSGPTYAVAVMHTSKNGNVQKRQMCNFCKSMLKSTFQEFHLKYAHKGGKACDDCGRLFFTTPQYSKHKSNPCNSSRRSSQLITIQNGHLAWEIGVVHWKVFALTLHRPDEVTMWIGTTTIIEDSVAAAKQAVSFVDRAFDRGLTKGVFCPSLMDLLHPAGAIVVPWKWNPGNAFFFDNVPGGSTKEPTTKLKFMLRTMYDVPCRNKMTTVEVIAQPIYQEVVKMLMMTSLVPTYHEQYFYKHHVSAC